MKFPTLFFQILFLTLLVACGSSASNNHSLDSTSYIENKGSDTIVNLALAWAELYQQEHPEIRISVTGGGSGTGIASLINGTVDIANASRQIKPEELEQAMQNGIRPIEYIIARDAIAVIVNPLNPTNRMTLQQLSDIYSGKIDNWLEINGDDHPIVRLSRETNSGTHVYFLETVIRMGDNESKLMFSMDTLLLPSSEGIINEVRQNPNAIGYDGLGYVPTDGSVKVIAIAQNYTTSFVQPSIDSVNNDSYPIARDLYMYTAGEPSGAIKDYIDWIRFSPDAQEIILELGFVPINSEP